MIFRTRRNRHAALAGALALVLALSGAPRTRAQGLALDVSNTNGTSAQASFTAGWTFTVVNTITVDGLAIFDGGSNGLIRDHTVGLWRSDGTLLISSAVTNANSSPVSAADPQGRWLVHPIVPLVLTPGTYAIGSDYQNSEADAIFTGGSLTTNPNIIFGAQRIGGVDTGVLTIPTLPLLNTAGVFGPNFRIAASASTPEPGTCALILLGGTLICLRRCASRRLVPPIEIGV
jgi:hypothetical protein